MTPVNNYLFIHMPYLCRLFLPFATPTEQINWLLHAQMNLHKKVDRHRTSFQYEPLCLVVVVLWCNQCKYNHFTSELKFSMSDTKQVMREEV